MKHLAIIILTLLPLASFGQGKDSDETGYILIGEPVPAYPGGHDEMSNFIRKNLKYPNNLETVQGKVYVRFTVNEDGSLSDFSILKGLVDSYDSAALLIVKKMPNWIPAKRDNKPIRTEMVIPIIFD